MYTTIVALDVKLFHFRFINRYDFFYRNQRQNDTHTIPYKHITTTQIYHFAWSTGLIDVISFNIFHRSIMTTAPYCATSFYFVWKTAYRCTSMWPVLVVAWYRQSCQCQTKKIYWFTLYMSSTWLLHVAI